MARLNKDDLKQMNRGYFESLEKERLVEVANNLHILAVEQWEKINCNSGNTSQPPSADNPFKKLSNLPTSTPDCSQEQLNSSSSPKKNSSQTSQATESKQKRKPGKQKGAKGFGRSKPLKVSVIIPHYPRECSACNQT